MTVIVPAAPFGAFETGVELLSSFLASLSHCTDCGEQTKPMLVVAGAIIWAITNQDYLGKRNSRLYVCYIAPNFYTCRTHACVIISLSLADEEFSQNGNLSQGPSVAHHTALFLLLSHYCHHLNALVSQIWRLFMMNAHSTLVAYYI